MITSSSNKIPAIMGGAGIGLMCLFLLSVYVVKHDAFLLGLVAFFGLISFAFMSIGVYIHIKEIQDGKV